MRGEKIRMEEEIVKLEKRPFLSRVLAPDKGVKHKSRLEKYRMSAERERIRASAYEARSRRVRAKTELTRARRARVKQYLGVFSPKSTRRRVRAPRRRDSWGWW